jgi:hypothetical protein
MKRIIDGLKYDTDTAALIAEWDNGIYGSDFKSCEESLYKTAKGAYFIAGEGGPMSKYAQPVGNNGMGSGSGLEPLDREEAFAWLCEKGFEEVAETEFPDLITEA